MAELKIFIPDSLNIRFRRAAMNAYGYGRGSLSKAAAEALAEWCKEKESKQTLETNKAEGTVHMESPSAPKPHPEILTGPENERAPVAGGT
ncbi:hypothetical protein E6H16_01580 [Candidatus Bathyarchaeota archaeon]|nr:MAG: hypothetical protein E6H16_01580 [Candidatus Bathyarchaeota archaeon]